MGPHEYDPDDVFYGVESAADAAADEVLEQDALLREHGIDLAEGYDAVGDLTIDLEEI